MASDVEGPAFKGYRSRGTLNAPLAVQANDELLAIGASAYDGTGWTSSDIGGLIIFIADENWSSTGHGSAIQFFTTSIGGSSRQERMRITSSGSVGIGTSSPAEKLHVVGDIHLGTGTNGCVKDATGAAIAGTCSSDFRFKKNIQPLRSKLKEISQLRPVTYKWRSEEFPDKHFGHEKHR